MHLSLVTCIWWYILEPILELWQPSSVERGFWLLASRTIVVPRLGRATPCFVLCCSGNACHHGLTCHEEAKAGWPRPMENKVLEHVFLVLTVRRELEIRFHPSICSSNKSSNPYNYIGLFVLQPVMWPTGVFPEFPLPMFFCLGNKTNG